MTDIALILCLVNLGFSLICDLVILHNVSEFVKSCMRRDGLEKVRQMIEEYERGLESEEEADV